MYLTPIIAAALRVEVDVLSAPADALSGFEGPARPTDELSDELRFV